MSDVTAGKGGRDPRTNWGKIFNTHFAELRNKTLDEFIKERAGNRRDNIRTTWATEYNTERTQKNVQEGKEWTQNENVFNAVLKTKILSESDKTIDDLLSEYFTQQNWNEIKKSSPFKKRIFKAVLNGIDKETLAAESILKNAQISVDSQLDIKKGDDLRSTLTAIAKQVYEKHTLFDEKKIDVLYKYFNTLSASKKMKPSVLDESAAAASPGVLGRSEAAVAPFVQPLVMYSGDDE